MKASTPFSTRSCPRSESYWDGRFGAARRLIAVLDTVPRRCTIRQSDKASLSSAFVQTCFPLCRSCPLTRKNLPRSQGYAFKVITSLEGLEQLDNLVYPTRAEQIELLQSVLLANETDADLGAEDTGKEVGTSRYNSPAPGPGGLQATRIAGSLQALSGCVFLVSLWFCEQRGR